ncbi:MAG: prolipoprotein diacylglyceryl transferase [Deltaproteobacteria bacterium]|nr:prolipoprotein diacylglyceryl transferase [Deltaproteobacteria bacterium]
MRYPDINPILIQMGPIQIRWYGLMYVIGFLLAYFIMLRISKDRRYDLKRQDIEDLLAYCILGLILGARLGYCLIYNLPYYWQNPFKIIAVWEGGMSFHGGMIGVIVVGWIYSIKRHKPFLMLADLGAVSAPLGLFLGRIGNFINAELYGRVTDMPWGIIFPGAGPYPRHPSQLYEAFFEGMILFIIVYRFSKHRSAHGNLFAVFLIGYGSMRFFLEFFRQPDPQLGFILGLLTMGQLLCLAMVIFGILLFWQRLKLSSPYSDKV